MPDRSSRSAAPILAAVALTFAACGPGTQPSAASISATPTAPGASAAPTAVATSGATRSAPPSLPYAGAAAVIPVGAGPRGVAEAGGSIWIASALGNVLERVDPATNAVVGEVKLTLPVTVVTVGAQLWVSVLNVVDTESDDEVVQVDPATAKVVTRIKVPVFHNIAAGDGAIWAVDGAGSLRRVDPASGKVQTMATVGGKSIGIAANDVAVWGIRDDGVSWRIPTAGGDLRTAPLGVQVPGRSRVTVAPGKGFVWVGVPGTVLALDPDDLSVKLTLALPGMTLVNDLWATDDGIWLSANVIDSQLGLAGGAVIRLDPVTAAVVKVYPLGPESSGGIVTGDALWAVDQHDNVLVRYALQG